MSSRPPALPPGETPPSRPPPSLCAECERRDERVAALRALVHALPARNYDMLRLVVAHLRR